MFTVTIYMHLLLSSQDTVQYVERETYRYNITIVEHLHQTAQTHTKQHV